MSSLLRYLCIAGAIVVLLTACGPAPTAQPSTPEADEETVTGEATATLAPEPQETEPPAVAAEEGYPAAPTTDPNAAYPEPETSEASAYPPPATEGATGGPLGPVFELEPAQAGDTTVSGVGPVDVQIAIANVTFAGEMLGTGRSDEEGNFSISVEPLTEGHRIGVSIIPQDASSTAQDVAQEYFAYRGDDYMNLPNVGVFFDTITVSP